MSVVITIERLEKAVNDCKKVQPPVNYVLGHDLRKLCDVWGQMIGDKRKTLDLATLDPVHLAVVKRWLGAAADDANPRTL